MTVTVRNIIPSTQVANAQTTQYTALNCKTIIDKFTVTNNGITNVSFSVNLVPAAGAVSNTNLILNARVLIPGETYTCPELVGQVLENGGQISTLAGAASSLTASAAGREIT